MRFRKSCATLHSLCVLCLGHYNTLGISDSATFLLSCMKFLKNVLTLAESSVGTPMICDLLTPPPFLRIPCLDAKHSPTNAVQSPLRYPFQIHAAEQEGLGNPSSIRRTLQESRMIVMGSLLWRLESPKSACYI